ncbi:MAG TPA: tRNA pseudouridine(38-40) synthase TruA [Pirellulales bacterium]
MPRTFKLTLAYDGTAYAGWQLQAGHPTLQGALEAALADLTGNLVRVIGSGRTDSGVHALGQVVSFTADTPLTPDALTRALNARLPDDIAVLTAEEAAPGFHAIHDAVAKRYRYVLHDGRVRDVFSQRYAWHLRTRVDADLMHQAAQHWLGRHDFKSFQSSGSRRITTERTVSDISVVRGWHGDGDLVVLEVEADGFLYNMVRAMVGTLVTIGRGKQPIDWAGEVLAAGNRKLAGMTAPAHGLFMLHVRYAPGGGCGTTGLNLPHSSG